MRTTPPSLLLTPASRVACGAAAAGGGEALVLRLADPKTKSQVVKMWAPVWVDVHPVDTNCSVAGEAALAERSFNFSSKTWMIFVRHASDAQVLREMRDFLYSGKCE